MILVHVQERCEFYILWSTTAVNGVQKKLIMAAENLKKAAQQQHIFVLVSVSIEHESISAEVF